MLLPVHFQVRRHACIDSTSERLFAALAAGEARSGDVVVAEEQTAGRGRRGRTWYSPRGEGLYMSVLVVAEPGAPPVPAPAWTLAGGLAVHALVQGLGVADARLDWPNDLVVRGAKLAGVLAESRAFAPAHCVVGIGLDVAQRAFPKEWVAERTMTSLALEGIERRPEDLVGPLLEELGPRLEVALAGGTALVGPFLAAMGVAEGRVRIETPDGPRTGRLIDFDPARGLVLATDRGDERWPLEHLRDLAPV